MSFKLGSSVIVVSLLLSPCAYAKSNAEIPCPALATIQVASFAVDQVAQNAKDTYTAGTSRPVLFENHLQWLVMAANIQAKSGEEALIVGKKFIKAINLRMTDYAVPVMGAFICSYGPQSVTAMGSPAPGSLANPS